MKKLLFIVQVLLVFPSLYSQEKNIDEGKKIFSTRCMSCHSIKNKLVGPALKNIQDKRSEGWIISFIQNSQKMIKSGDADAVAIFNKYNQSIMPPHEDLKNNDVQNIIEYIKVESSKIVEIVNIRPYEVKGKQRPITFDNYWLMIIFGATIILMIYAFNILIESKSLK